MTESLQNPVQQLITVLGKFPRPAQLRALLQHAGGRFRRIRVPRPHAPLIVRRQEELMATGRAGVHQLSDLHCLNGRGPSPTIVLGGFVPDSTESVFLLGTQLARQGTVFCINYARTGFCLDLLFAQLDDLVDEINLTQGRQPVILSVSFGCGVVLEWLRRRRLLGGQPAIQGLVFVSPVSCVQDLFPSSKPRASTLLGRAIQPYLNPDSVDPKNVERSRAVFSKMFEAGAQNHEALAALMTREQVLGLRERVMNTIRGISFQGACERVSALRNFLSPRQYFLPGVLPLSEVPSLILYAEREDAVLDEEAPSLHAFRTAHLAYFPRSRCLLLRNPKGSPVQHASLIFHKSNFAPVIARFYRTLRPRWTWRNAA